MVVELKDLESFSQREYGKSIMDIEDNSKVFTSLCEVLAEKHPETEDIDEIRERYEDSDKLPEEFLEEMFDDRVSEDVLGVVNKAHKNTWVKYAVERMVENNII